MTWLQKPAKGTARRRQDARKRAATRVFLANCATVRERDGGRCRVYGTADWCEVHHIVYRSRGGGDETSNLVLLSKRAHDEVHAGRLRITVGPLGADGRLEFFARETVTSLWRFLGASAPVTVRAA